MKRNSMPATKKYLLTGLFLAIVTIILDQVTKHAILEMFQNPPNYLNITSFFDLVLTWNKGISFGFASSYGDTGTMILIGLSIAISIGLLIWLTRVTNIYLACGLGLIIGGAIGNVIDRFRFKAVVDFLYFHLDTFSFPAFNVADTAITIGVGFILLESFIVSKGEHRA
jgi:signal peptidase II